MSTTERYARVYNSVGGLEGTVGVELRDEDNLEFINESIFNSLTAALINCRSHDGVVRRVERWIRCSYPDRAFFIETERAGCGVQVYQPYGMPRANQPAQLS